MEFRDIAGYMECDLSRVKSLMRESLSSDIALLNSVNESLMTRPGKMVRPVLSLLCARACSGGVLTEDSYRFAAATELLHNATLLHDDVADNASSRRGNPTVNALLGSRASVLLGDFWLVRAVERILGASESSDMVIRLFARTLGDLSEGEMLQLQKASSGDTSEADYYRIIYQKTASLFVSAALSAVMSVSASEACADAVGEYASSLGTAFQIKDDMFDYGGGSSIGKTVGLDLLEQKITLPLLGALADVSPQEASRVREKVVKIHEHPGYQAEIVDFVHAHGGMEYAAARLDEYVEKAISALGGLPAGKDRDCLEGLARYMADRKK